jgi:hypothetical protein
LNPECGYACNQIAVVEATQHSSIKAIFWYMKALLCPYPFKSAYSNMCNFLNSSAGSENVLGQFFYSLTTGDESSEYDMKDKASKVLDVIADLIPEDLCLLIIILTFGSSIFPHLNDATTRAVFDRVISKYSISSDQDGVIFFSLILAQSTRPAVELSNFLKDSLVNRREFTISNNISKVAEKVKGLPIIEYKLVSPFFETERDNNLTASLLKLLQ